ncbi:MAG: ATP-dependent DNA helicase RecG [Clostridia bacterium]|nr:ATP-dependent DNA helicase RecG [Clostridia bacterium]
MSTMISKPLSNYKGVGGKRAELFNKLGVGSSDALLRYYPREYEDWSGCVSVAEAKANAQSGEMCCIRATVTSQVQSVFLRGGKILYTARAVDGEGMPFRLTFFNNAYIPRMLVKGSEYTFRGRLVMGRNGAEMASPAFSENPSPRLVPVYRATEGLPSRQIAKVAEQVLAELPDDLSDPLPEWIRVKYQLCHIRYALCQIHFPDDKETLTTVRDRLVFEELLLLQLGLLRLKGRERGAAGTVLREDHTEEFWSMLPFAPTGAQRRAAKEAVADMMSGERPMSRLLQGDVGSGKTAVAAAICYTAAKNGVQSALMAPTEILAEQHFRSLEKLLSPCGIRVGQLTGSMTVAQKRRMRELTATGQIDVLIGTHALIADGVTFASLGLVITDEQHRFGVNQRGALAAKGNNPHILVMSATPIPRTLALMIYGDLDLSLLDEMPAGRMPVDTFYVDGGKRERAYGFVKKLTAAGRQGYVICPLVEEQTDPAAQGSLKAAQSYAASLSEGYLSGCRVGLLHGRMKGAEKESVMRQFAAGELDVLVSTTVVEVGVNVPNAVIMVIENAERFGLSQLHQLRGRVGRGEWKSYCILISDARNEAAVARLQTMCRTRDGFAIANEDLKQRGPGDFFGSRQHGLPDLKIADMMTDMQMFAKAQEAAREILEKDPHLTAPEHCGLTEEIDKLFDPLRAMN